MMQEPLRYVLEVWQERQDSNLRPAVLETAALPTELRSYDISCWILLPGLAPVNHLQARARRKTGLWAMRNPTPD